MDDDFISRKWLMECVDKVWVKFDTERDKNIYIHLVRDLAPSADVVEVVRCKDCVHYMPYDWMFSEVWQSQNIEDYPQKEIGCEWVDHYVKPDDFCSLGERKGGE